MRVRIDAIVVGEVELEDFSSLEAAVEHVLVHGDIDHIHVLPVDKMARPAVFTGVSAANESRGSVKGSGEPAAPHKSAGSVSGVSIPPVSGAVRDESGGAPSASGDTVAVSPAPADSTPVQGPASNVTITEVRAYASHLIAKDQSAQPKIVALLREYGAANMTLLGDKPDVLPEFMGKLQGLAA